MRGVEPAIVALSSSVGLYAETFRRFPERHMTTVHLPESFRGGCSFGVGQR
jgi:hypothetical protein